MADVCPLRLILGIVEDRGKTERFSLDSNQSSAKRGEADKAGTRPFVSPFVGCCRWMNLK